MPKPRGRRTSAEPRRTVKASSGRARAQPRDKAGQRGVAEAGSPAALRDRHERPAASARATPGKAKAAAARPAAPAKRSATSRKVATTERAAAARKGAATERPAARKGAATERPAARKGAAAERPAAPRLRPARARADEHARAAPPKRRPRSEEPASEADDAELSPPRPPELDWDDTPSDSAEEALAQRWAARGEELFQQLAEHGASQHEHRADLKDGRFVWIAPGGRVSAEARARLLCSWSRTTSVVVMAWADPLVSSAGVERIDGMPAEQDSVDEEGAWQIAMRAADACGAAYLYRVSSPQAWYFVALDDLTFSPKRASFHPGAPVGLVLRAIGEVREAIASRAEPADVIRDRISALSDSLFHQARYAYRDTDWVARLDRTGSCLMHLAKRIPRACFSAVAAGQRVDEWLDRELAIELINALSLIEDEWSLFG
ncbi:DUF6882 domain-containing protein [Sorangium cellulosum]|uniref:Uncharacterized protein n=1 Tax=Sorangium cellulosum So0157-2 TaxID=1254432 RepID=S4YCT7_SORCE|nr:DUF6882 domain-containing protein [Sorangium cellulosum]AGP42176.1 hypothetical protein SCE1572_51365 [Sorangium cellulosum So0157-2]